MWFGDEVGGKGGRLRETVAAPYENELTTRGNVSAVTYSCSRYITIDE